MPDAVFRNVITVLDQATAPLRKINTQIDALGAPVRHLGLSLGEVGAAAGLGKLKSSATTLIERFGTLRESVMGLVEPLGLIGGGLAVGGFIELTRSASEYGAKLHDAAIMTGIQADQLARLHYMAKLTNVDTGALDMGLTRLNKIIGDAAGGHNVQALQMFQRLGISLRDSQGHLRSAADVWGDLAEAVQKNTNATLRAEIAGNAFGSRSGMMLIPVLEKGRDALKNMGAEADYLGLTLGQAGVDNAKKFEDSWIKVQSAAQGLQYAIGAQLFPVLQPMLESMTRWIAANRTVIATKLKDFVVSVASALQRVDWAGVARDALWFARATKSIVDHLGGFKIVMGAVALLATGSFLKSIYDAGKALGDLGLELGKVVMKLGTAFVVGPILDFVTAIRAGYGAMAALNMIMAANPIGLIVTAVAALGFAAFELYEHWSGVKAFFVKLWHEVAAAFGRAWAIIKPILDPLGAAIDLVNRFTGHADAGAAAAAVASRTGARGGMHHLPPPAAASFTGAPLPHAVPRAAAALAGAPLPQAPRGFSRAHFLAQGVPQTSVPVTAPSTAGNEPLATSLYSPGGAGPGPAPQNGEVKVKVDVSNLPPGSKVTTETRGKVAPPETSVGYSWGNNTAAAF
ncbi:MAG TPA: phage tail tape measure protein [Alphaproteobacteria bacterium]|nr:phage tail tape measure protein [Alphaproteobacteria bacterium]